jgi:lactoylglutathione lyase
MGREAGIRLELFVDDMEASIAFYTRMPAFELARHEPGDYASLHLGGVVLGVGPVAKLPEEGGYFARDIATLRRGLGVEIVFEVDDLDGWRDRVAASGHEILDPLQERPLGAQGLQDHRPRRLLPAHNVPAGRRIAGESPRTPRTKPPSPLL